MSSKRARAFASGQVERARSLHNNAVYDVREGKQLVSWRAVPLSFTRDVQSLTPGAAESRAVRALRNPHLLRHMRTLPAPEVDALYLISEPLPDRTLSILTETAVNDRSIFREGFLWRALHQLASASKCLQHLQLQFFTVRFHPDHIYVDRNSVIKVDPFSVTHLESISNVSPCKNDICTVGAILNDAISQTEQSPENFQNVLNQLLHAVGSSCKCQILPDIVLHHPTVLFNLDDFNEIFAQRSNTSRPTNDSAFESDDSSLKIDFSLPSVSSPALSVSTFKDVSLRIVESIDGIHLSPTVLALDLKIPGYVPRKPPRMNRSNSRSELSKEPKDVSEDTLNRVWLERLTDLQKREDAIKLKEKEIAKRNIFDKIWSEIPPLDEAKIKHDDSSECIAGITLQSVMTEKIFHDTQKLPPSKTIQCATEKIQSKPLSKKPYHRSNSLKGKSRKKRMQEYEDMDSSLSADPGDTSILPTSTKISAETVPRPSAIENFARRKVHFNSRNNPFAEYESVSSTTLTFFEIEDVDPTYEIPRKVPVKPEDITEKIAKFSYFDLEAMTNSKRAQMDDWRKTPPLAKSNLKVFTGENQSISDGLIKKPDPVTVRKSRRQKYLSPTLEKYSSTTQVNHYSSQSENSYKSVISLPCMTRLDSRRKSMGLRQDSHNTLSTAATSDNQKNKLSTRASFYCTRSSNAAKKLIDNVKGVGQTKKKVNDTAMEESENKENSRTPVSVKNKGRMSILGFKTPFKFKF